MKIVIAGGTGLIGKQLEVALSNNGHQVQILTRSPKKDNHIKWNPYSKQIELDKMANVEAIINLCGSGIADSKWTAKRRKELEDSRILPAEYLAEISQELKHLKHYITASGITCFGFDDIRRLYTEEDAYGEDYTSQLVKKWEETLSLFPEKIHCLALRFGIVLSDQGGAIPRISQPVKLGAGAALGSGKQIVQWLDIHEIPNIVEHVLKNALEGTFNVLQGNVTNKELTKSIAK
ncbi:MAG: NAD-dependent epimerase/dehydratase family protein, partial [Crocinitomicaceae bacterium]